jgi:O-acetyl-ADP-ribose deacetylase (regulator of RNase III)
VVKIIKGDLLASNAMYIAHQVNCRGVMGAGVARQISDRYPKVADEYRAVCKINRPAQLLGTAHNVWIDKTHAIVNIFGQDGFGRDGRVYTDYNALEHAFSEMERDILTNDSIAMPYRIGCGLANGDWGKVLDLLTDIFEKHDLTLYKL